MATNKSNPDPAFWSSPQPKRGKSHDTALSSLPLRFFSIKLHLVETSETFPLSGCYQGLTVRKLKHHLELLTGVPLHFQRLQYLDEVDLPDESTFKYNDIVPGGTIRISIWRQDDWGLLVAAAAEGDLAQLIGLGVVKGSESSTPNSQLMGPAERKEWIAHRAFVALYITSHRGHIDAIQFLLQNGANLHSKTPLGRTALHAATVMGRCDCIDLLLSWGALPFAPDNEGQTAMSLARLWGQKQSERRLFHFQWQQRSTGTVPPSPSQSLH
nr:ankyrin repeat domain-containing protein 60 isoform X1 [Pelodiscus sinensis]XP_025041549.1 ankyrin repeat domain-containing protein 60 isoform X1 [Pelodiscus sinensis]XP_025041550.1 ankyrin repeat domain-containing protein 60 isoform X1 [Pelodiscus sinensis]XP_025041551.1 ankyrin repeat domain-containing protein 60 isoform X1 [Pelodiscus sinensis]|eukprot:XP_025041548.1 ankyrin repeat domain-containing protein 60 isoform X1 [Pelodiscus sinensis]